VPQALYAVSAALCISDRAGVQSKPQPKPAHTNFGLQPYIAPVCRFNGLQPRDLCKYMNYYSFNNPWGMEGWVGLVGWSIVGS